MPQMAKRLCAACILVLGMGIPSPAALSAGAPFPDMEKSWFGYQDAVRYLMARDAISGYPDGTFKPTATVNRAEFLKLVIRSHNSVEPIGSDCFADVPADAWYARYVCAAKRRNIVKGYDTASGSMFKPEQTVVFAEAVKMLQLAHGKTITEPAGERWYKPYVDLLDQEKILGSWSYIPWAPLTRERAADLIARYQRYDDERLIGNLSAGCGKAARDASLTLSVNGTDRTYLLTTPGSANISVPSPLIVAFHGRTNANDRVRQYFGLDKTATDAYIAYPAALEASPGSFSWADPGDSTSNLRDYAFFDAIVKELSSTYCIDMDRIFVVGHSLGAYMANSVACARGGIVRASATVGGSTTMRNCSGPSAAMIINNPHDTLSPHAAAESMRDVRTEQNACLRATSDVEPKSLSCQRFGGCPDNPVVFCPHTIDDDRGTYYPHTWPPGTEEAMVAFFRGLD